MSDTVTVGNTTLINAPAPWTCKLDNYWVICSMKKPLPMSVYDPLETSFPPFSDPTVAGEFKGGLGMVQIVRYHETPVGTYNELIVIPGNFEIPARENEQTKKQKHLRITRIYVDQKDTTYNGRKNWNIPKHLARFTFSTLSNPHRIKFQAFPPDPAITVPFFTATIQPFTWLPSFPFSTAITPYLGLDPTLVQPPLPASKAEGEEFICGTDKWARAVPSLESRGKLAWVSVEQPAENSENEEERAVASWWPKIQPWSVGFAFEDATLRFPISEIS